MPHLSSYKKVRSSGFSLVEIIVVVSIIAILAVIGLVVYSNTKNVRNDAKMANDINNLNLALEQFYQDKGYYPGTLGADPTPLYHSDNPDPWLPELAPEYIAEVPKNPIGTARYDYWPVGRIYDLTPGVTGGLNCDYNVRGYILAAQPSGYSTSDAEICIVFCSFFKNPNGTRKIILGAKLSQHIITTDEKLQSSLLSRPVPPGGAVLCNGGW